MAKAAIKLEGYIGSTKVCNDLILGGYSKNHALSDVYSKMIYVGIEGLKNPEESKEEDDFGDIVCPITDFTVEQQTIEKKLTST